MKWTFETFHTARCRRHLEDPGATCICRAWSRDCACGEGCAPDVGCRSAGPVVGEPPFRVAR